MFLLLRSTQTEVAPSSWAQDVVEKAMLRLALSPSTQNQPSPDFMSLRYGPMLAYSFSDDFSVTPVANEMHRTRDNPQWVS